MLTLDDDNDNIIHDHIGNFTDNISPDYHLVGNFLNINHVFSNTDCVCTGNFGAPTDCTHHCSLNSVYHPWEIDLTDEFFVPTAAPDDLFDPAALLFFH